MFVTAVFAVGFVGLLARMERSEMLLVTIGVLAYFLLHILRQHGRASSLLAKVSAKQLSSETDHSSHASVIGPAAIFDSIPASAAAVSNGASMVRVALQDHARCVSSRCTASVVAGANALHELWKDSSHRYTNASRRCYRIFCSWAKSTEEILSMVLDSLSDFVMELEVCVFLAY
eukprot:TRINITY_DN29654_c0_g1_i1.p1 TRINITY_DN29654_c0_g1~~TRINITY_DN29654_c0_g1_i1.p1  ORF type:complete len:175 (+),score=21.82 TRINITY_DN29654_c0_g1_i1:229-753(+)